MAHNVINKFKQLKVSQKNDKAKNKNNNFPPILILILESALPILPNVFHPIIAGYSFDDSQDNAKIIVSQRLYKSLRSISYSNIFHSSFGSSFCIYISNKLVSINLSDDYLVLNVSRIFFKWMLFMERENAKKNKPLDVSKTIQTFISKIDRNNNIGFPSSLNILTMGNHVFSKFIKLIIYEIIDESRTIFPLFSSLIQDYYVTGIKSQEIRIKYFNGDYRNNLLLKYMILLYDPLGVLRSACFDQGECSRFPAFEMRLSKLILEEEDVMLKYINDLKTNGPTSLGRSFFIELKRGNSIQIKLERKIKDQE